MLTSNTMKRNQKNNWATTAMKKGGHWWRFDYGSNFL